MIEDVAEGGMALMPAIGRVRLLRTWGGIMDMSMDGSPFIDKTPVEGSISTAAGAMAGSRRPRQAAGASRISWRRMSHISRRGPIVSTGS